MVDDAVEHYYCQNSNDECYDASDNYCSSHCSTSAESSTCTKGSTCTESVRDTPRQFSVALCAGRQQETRKKAENRGAKLHNIELRPEAASVMRKT